MSSPGQEGATSLTVAEGACRLAFADMLASSNVPTPALNTVPVTITAHSAHLYMTHTCWQSMSGCI